MSRLAPGTVLGDDFEIVRPLAEGGMGAVYEATQKSTGAMRAIKTMRPELAKSAEFAKRFAQEARISAKIDSDHVVEVLSAGIDEATGVPWLAMELVRGKHLGDWIDERGPMAPALARSVLAQTCHALAAAHRVGIVHRDLKPENLLVASGKTAGHTLAVKILDFGIAKLITAAESTTTAAMGTPLWMAPEQTVAGASVSPATDVWALGLVAFFVLTGRAYWMAANVEGGTPAALLREIAIDDIEPASKRAARFERTLPDGFDDWFARCVAREPKDRFADASHAAPELDVILRAASRDEASEATTAGPGATLARTAPIDELAVQSPFAKTAPLPDDTASDKRAATATSFAEKTRPEMDSVPPKPPPRWMLPVIVVAAVGSVVAIYEFKGASGRSVATPTPSAAAASSGGVASRGANAPGASDFEETGVRMIRVPGASYRIGSDAGPDDERPPTPVSVAAFSIDAHEVTARAYHACVTAGRCTPAGTGEGCTAGRQPRHPINCVSFEQAKAYCGWVEKRLPSETEWELAARGPAQRRYPWGSEPPDDSRLCWKQDGTCEVGAHTAGRTPEGIEDLAGNVWEWTTGKYCPYDKPTCTEDRRTTRGGSWASTDPALVTSTVRHESFEDNCGTTVGFRCARTL